MRHLSLSLGRKALISVAMIAALSACVPATNSTTSAPVSTSVSALASKGSLSAEAIRMKGRADRLVSLEEEQKAATSRVSQFGTQGAVAGAIVGGLAGYLLCANCSDSQRAAAVLAGAGGGGVVGNQAGKAQAQRQNTAAERENALKRRISVASTQLSTTSALRADAERVLARHQRALAKAKADVAAGRAKASVLETARANAAADAKEIHDAGSLITKASASVRAEASQDTTGKLKVSSQGLDAEKAKTDAAYAALVSSIQKSAL